MLSEKLASVSYSHATQGDLLTVLGFESRYMQTIEPESYLRWKDSRDKQIQYLHQNLSRMFVARSKGEVIGACYWGINNHQPAVYSIYVRSSWRRNNIASRLISCVENDIRARSFHHISLSTKEHNPAQYLFIKLGYVLDGKSTDGWLNYIKRLV